LELLCVSWSRFLATADGERPQFPKIVTPSSRKNAANFHLAAPFERVKR